MLASEWRREPSVSVVMPVFCCCARSRMTPDDTGLIPHLAGRVHDPRCRERVVHSLPIVLLHRHQPARIDPQRRVGTGAVPPPRQGRGAHGRVQGHHRHLAAVHLAGPRQCGRGFRPVAGRCCCRCGSSPRSCYTCCVRRWTWPPARGRSLRRLHVILERRAATLWHQLLGRRHR